tara:strand:+ start:3781 stop:4005 length:225 start_codon:yes stop_codon:yes gene_type:complete
MTLRTFTVVSPSLETAQEIVGGYVGLIPLSNGDQLLFDEDGEMKDLPLNEEASAQANLPILGNCILLTGPAKWD